jgi:phospholipase/lecithinase/hemolysin
MFIRRSLAVFGVALTVTLSSTSALAFSQLIAFGDSLSDTGNLAVRFGGAVPGAPYVNGRFSNGPVAPEVLAVRLNVSLKSYAFGGALTSEDNQFAAENPLLANTGMKAQINTFLGEAALKGGVDADALYMIWGGGNDFLSVINSGDISGIHGVVRTAVTNLVTEVGTLYAAGARHVLVPLLPDLASTFYGTSGAIPPALLNSLSVAFNGALANGLNQLQAGSPGLDLTVFDTPGFLAGVRQDLIASGGNVTDRCWSGDYAGANATGPVCANPDQYYLFDKVHPTGLVHRKVGDALAASVVPEPATSGLMLAGLLMTGLAICRQRKA